MGREHRAWGANKGTIRNPDTEVSQVPGLGGAGERGMWGRGKQSQRASQGNEKCHPSTGSGL